MGGSTTNIRSHYVDVEGPNGTTIRRKVPANLSMYIRNQNWEQQKKEKLDRQKSAKEEKA